MDHYLCTKMTRVGIDEIGNTTKPMCWKHEASSNERLDKILFVCVKLGWSASCIGLSYFTMDIGVIGEKAHN
jgi:hypothetical protein